MKNNVKIRVHIAILLGALFLASFYLAYRIGRDIKKNAINNEINAIQDQEKIYYE